jgi:hypothetical protein
MPFMTILSFATLLRLLVPQTAAVLLVTAGAAPGLPPDSTPVAAAMGRAAAKTASGVASDAAPVATEAAVYQLDVGLRTADSLVSSWVDAERVPGAVLLVAEDGRTVLERAYGWAQLYDYGDGQYGDWAGGSDVGRDAAFQPDSVIPPGIRRLTEPVPMTTATVFDMASVT